MHTQIDAHFRTGQGIFIFNSYTNYDIITYVLKSFPLFNQLSQRVLYDACSPLVYFILAVVHTSNYALDALHTYKQSI